MVDDSPHPSSGWTPDRRSTRVPRSLTTGVRALRIGLPGRRMSRRPE